MLKEICSCGKIHTSDVKTCVIEKGAINRLPDFLKNLNIKKLFY